MAPKAAAAPVAKKVNQSKFYPADDVAKPLKRKVVKKPTKLR